MNEPIVNPMVDRERDIYIHIGMQYYIHNNTNSIIHVRRMWFWNVCGGYTLTFLSGPVILKWISFGATIHLLWFQISLQREAVEYLLTCDSLQSHGVTWPVKSIVRSFFGHLKSNPPSGGILIQFNGVSYVCRYLLAYSLSHSLSLVSLYLVYIHTRDTPLAIPASGNIERVM